MSSSPAVQSPQPSHQRSVSDAITTTPKSGATNSHRRSASVALTSVWLGNDAPVDIPSDEEENSQFTPAFFPLPSADANKQPPEGGANANNASASNLMVPPLSPSRTMQPVEKRSLPAGKGLAELSCGSPKASSKSIIFGSFRKTKKEQPHSPPKDAALPQDDMKKDDQSSTEDPGYVTDESGSSLNSTDMRDLTADFWEDVPEAPADAILGIAQAYALSTHPNKVNVCVGAYRDENGKPWVLPSVRQAERILLDNNDSKEYLPIDGDPDFVRVALQFAYGKDMDLDHVAGVQTLSGTGACRLGGTFLNRFWPRHPIYVPTPTWGNHITIFKEAGLDVRKYRYYNRTTNALDFRGMLRDIKKAPTGSIILLHACAHNPTGCDPTIEQWKQILSVMKSKEHVAFFDSAYQGFASGNAEDDAQPFRYAVSQHVPILLAQSFAKNFGLYGERCGTLSVVCGDAGQKAHILSELRVIIRPMYSSPPRHGSSIVKTILMSSSENGNSLKDQYYTECASMAARIKLMRTRLVEELQKAGSTHDWSHVTSQIGMFAFTGLTQEMCTQLTEEYAIYLTMNGRISMAGLNESNVEYVAKAIHSVSDQKSITGDD